MKKLFILFALMFCAVTVRAQSTIISLDNATQADLHDAVQIWAADSTGSTWDKGVLLSRLLAAITESSSSFTLRILDSASVDTEAELEALLTDMTDLLDGAGNETITGSWDFGGGSIEIANSTTLPGTCNVGQIYFDSDAVSGQGIYACESANNWVLQGDGGAGGGAIILDLGDDAANESSAIAEIATTNDTNSIFSEPSADKLLIAVGNNWPTADSSTGLKAADYGDITSAGGSLTIDTDAVDADAIAADAVGSSEIATGAVGAAEIATDAVGTAELDDDANSPTAGDIVRVETGGLSFSYLTPNAGTNIANDLEEEAHSSEHEDGGADEIAVTAGMMNADFGDFTCDGTATGCSLDVGGGDITTVGNCTTGDCGIEGGTDVFPLLYEGTANTSETTIAVTDPTADRTVTIPDGDGTVVLFQAGSGSMVDNGIVRYDQTTGHKIQSSNLWTIDDQGILATTTGAGSVGFDLQDRNGRWTGFLMDDNSNEILDFNFVASAVNYLEVSNSATANDPTITAAGGDTDVGINLVPKGTGTLQYNGTEVETIGHASKHEAGGSDELAVNGVNDGTLITTAEGDTLVFSIYNRKTAAWQYLSLDQLTFLQAQPTGAQKISTRLVDSTAIDSEAEFETLTGIDYITTTGAQTISANWNWSSAQMWIEEQTYTASTGALTPNMDNGNTFYITMDANLTVNDPTGIQGGAWYTYFFLQDGTGGRTVTRGGTDFPDSLHIDLDAGALTKITCYATADGGPFVRCWNDSYTVVSTYIPAGSFSTDGTQCGDPAKRQINSGARVYAVNCADNAASDFYVDFALPDGLANGDITVELVAENENATPSGILDFDFSASCRGDSDVLNSTFSTAANASITFATQYDLEQATTANITPNGTCQPGDHLFVKAIMDDVATTTQVADTYILGVKIEYAVESGD